MRTLAATSLALLLTLAPGGARGAENRLLFRVANAALITAEDMAQDLKKARVVFIGEQHPDPRDHEAQLAVIKALRGAGADLSVALEMFRANAQPELDRWVAGNLSEEEFFGLWADNWDAGYWPVYRDILYYAREHRIPLVGLNVPREIVRQVARKGFDSLSDAQRGELSVVRCDVDTKYRDLLGTVLGLKEKGGQVFGRFCEAQVLWDTAMAQNLLRSLEVNPNRLVVVLAGNFHAWKHGIPEQLERRSGVPYRVILPSSDDSFFRYDVFLEDADYVWWHE